MSQKPEITLGPDAVEDLRACGFDATEQTDGVISSVLVIAESGELQTQGDQ